MNRILYVLAIAPVLILSCKDEDVPDAENEAEVITDVRLIFNPTDGGGPLSFQAIDPDGLGPADLEVEGEILLSANTSYQLFIELSNEITGDDITEEVEEEGEEHKFFFEFTEGLFSSPEGNGNTDHPGDPVHYIDKDEDDVPVGLITGWVSGEAGNGTFRVVLKHQPEIKTESSTVQMGETDLDITWPIRIE